MTDERGQVILSRLVGGWQGTLLHCTAADEPLVEMPGSSENRWVLGGRFVEMTLRAGIGGDTWSAVFYIGYERNDRRHVLVSLEPGDRRVTTRLGEWTHDRDRLVMTGDQCRAVCDMATPGRLKLALLEKTAAGLEFTRFRADYRAMKSQPGVERPPVARQPRRFVIA